MAKKRKSLLPKKIAGVKVPKSVRKGRFGELLASPTGQAVIADALMAAGAASGGKKAKAGPKTAKAGDGKGKAAPVAGGGALAYALGEAARSFAEALQRHGAEGWTGRALIDEAEDSKKKPPVSYEAGPL